VKNKLPKWWTAGPPTRGSKRATHAEQKVFYEGWFAREVLGHKGGMTKMPELVE